MSVYNTRLWRDQVRPQKLARDPMCQAIEETAGADGWPSKRQCNLLADHVDHWNPLVDGGDPYAPENLVSLCITHHSAKTMAQRNAVAIPFSIAPSAPRKLTLV